MHRDPVSLVSAAHFVPRTAAVPLLIPFGPVAVLAIPGLPVPPHPRGVLPFLSHQDPQMRIPKMLTEVFTHRLYDTETDWAHLAQEFPYFRQYSGPDVPS